MRVQADRILVLGNIQRSGSFVQIAQGAGSGRFSGCAFVRGDVQTPIDDFEPASELCYFLRE